MGLSVKGRGHCEWCGGLCEGGPCKGGLCQVTHQYRDPLPRHRPLPEQWRPPKRVVRILECILVLKIKITPFFCLGNVQILPCLAQLLVHIYSKCPTVSAIHLQAKYTALTYNAIMRHITKCLFERIKNLQCYEFPRRWGHHLFYTNFISTIDVSCAPMVSTLCKYALIRKYQRVFNCSFNCPDMLIKVHLFFFLKKTPPKKINKIAFQ